MISSSKKATFSDLTCLPCKTPWILNEVASASFLSKSLVEVPNKAPNSTSSLPRPENVGSFLALSML